MVLAHGAEVQVVVSNTSSFTLETTGGNASADSNDVNGKELDSWKHLLDAMGGGVPSFLGSKIFAALLNTSVLRTGLKVICWAVKSLSTFISLSCGSPLGLYFCVLSSKSSTCSLKTIILVYGALLGFCRNTLRSSLGPFLMPSTALW